MDENGKKGRREGHYIPKEIVYDILLLLPTKSLLRFKSVCKNWCNIITSDPDFEELNLQHSMSKIRINAYYPVEYGYKHVSFKLEGKGLSATQESFFNMAPMFADRIVDSCKNFLLFRCEASSIIYVLDTITQQRKDLPEIQAFYDPRNPWKFAYDIQSMKYKVVVLHYREFKPVSNSESVCSFYTLNDENRNWRTYKLPPGFQRQRICPLIELNGVLYSVTRDPCSSYRRCIQPMDVANEKLMRIIQVPSPVLTYTDNYNLLEIKGSLGLMQPASPNDLEIWVLKDLIQSVWNRQHCISLSAMLNRPPCLRSFISDMFHPLLIMQRLHTTYILVAVVDQGVHRLKSKLYWYDIEAKQLQSIAIESSPDSTIWTSYTTSIMD